MMTPLLPQAEETHEEPKVGSATSGTERATRDRERTRTAIVEAATVMIAEHGAGVSLADIADRAGVSKGALTHHFSSRRELEEAMMGAAAERLRDEVFRHVRPGDERPGRLLRAYIRALTSDTEVTRELFSPTSILMRLGLDHANGPIFEQDAKAWREAFAADGIDPALSHSLRLAAEGVAASLDTPYLSAEEQAEVRARLLQLAGDASPPDSLPCPVASPTST